MRSLIYVSAHYVLAHAYCVFSQWILANDGLSQLHSTGEILIKRGRVSCESMKPWDTSLICHWNGHFTVISECS